MSWSEAHSTSERLAEAAHAELRNGNASAAQKLFAEAAQAETEALEALGSSKPRTYGITAVSAASLWFKAGEVLEAARIAEEASAAPNLPEFAAGQLRELRDTIRNSTPLRSMTNSEIDPIKRMQEELDQLVEYYRELERDLSKESKKEFDHSVMSELTEMSELAEFGNAMYDAIIGLTYKKKCSLAVATAALIEWRVENPYEIIVLPDGTTN
jgi:hypothetical protein